MWAISLGSGKLIYCLTSLTCTVLESIVLYIIAWPKICVLIELSWTSERFLIRNFVALSERARFVAYDCFWISSTQQNTRADLSDLRGIIYSHRIFTIVAPLLPSRSKVRNSAEPLWQSCWCWLLERLDSEPSLYKDQSRFASHEEQNACK